MCSNMKFQNLLTLIPIEKGLSHLIKKLMKYLKYLNYFRLINCCSLNITDLLTEQVSYRVSVVRKDNVQKIKKITDGLTDRRTDKVN